MADLNCHRTPAIQFGNKRIALDQNGRLIPVARRKIVVKSSIKLWATLLCLSYSLSAHGQSGRPPVGADKEDKDEVVRVRTDEVLLPVSVRDASGRFVAGLRPEEFIIYDDGVRQEIMSFNRRRVPVNIILLMDASGSVFSQMRFIRAAAKGFVNGLLKEDRVCVMQFADNVELLQDWTSAAEAAKLDKVLDWRYHPGMSTTFYDGMYLAAEEQFKNIEGRRIIILLTDGIDTAARRRASFDDALNAARRAEASVYVVSLTASLRAAIEAQTKGRLARLLAAGYDRRLIKQYIATIDEAERRLEQLAKQTGGRIFLPVENDSLAPAYRAIAEELRTQYIITYKPKPPAKAGDWRGIRVLVMPGGYDVAARTGYVGRP